MKKVLNQGLVAKRGEAGRPPSRNGLAECLEFGPERPISAATLQIIGAYKCFASVDPAALPDSAHVAYELACQSLCATLVALEEIISLFD
jgi:hypothetical protein